MANGLSSHQTMGLSSPESMLRATLRSAALPQRFLLVCGVVKEQPAQLILRVTLTSRHHGLPLGATNPCQ